MAISYTSKLGQSKPDDGEQDWGVPWRQDADRLEARLATSFAGNPNGEVAGFWVGQKCWDTEANELYFCVSATGNEETSIWAAYMPKHLGDPNGEVPGAWIGQLALDTENNELYLCTETGSAVTAVWEPYGSSSDKVSKTGDTMTGQLEIEVASAALRLRLGSASAHRTALDVWRTADEAALWSLRARTDGDLEFVRGSGAPSGAKFLVNGGEPWTGVSPVASTGANGYQRLPSGVLMNWGVQTGLASGGNRTVSLPRNFSNTNYHVMTQLRGNAFSGGSDVITGVHSQTTSSFQVYNNASMTIAFSWFAIGVG